MRQYPIGIQDFAKIINGNMVYVDKTDLVYQLASSEGVYFLSRPRRFGKSLLVSTLKYYFQGRKDLFKGLGRNIRCLRLTSTAKTTPRKEHW